MKIFITFICLIICTYSNNYAEELYFPSIVIGEKWETLSPDDLGWNTDKIPALYDFLENKNSKAFILLKDGKIILEKYFGDFTQDSNWYWASAGKTITATLTGLAQEEGLLNINDKTSKYLGEGWTSMEKNKEDLITIRNQLTMTTGLDYGVDDSDCTEPECLKYKADAGSQWYYHNAPYTLLENVVVSASDESYNQYFFRKIRNRIGMNGAWFKLGFNNIYFSTPRSMARFGLLMLGNGNWADTEVIPDKQYLNDMINTSNDLNKSYGYLWWLNGKESFMIPGTSKVFKGMLYPNAPADAYAALGKDGQILCIAPSKGLVMVRMGDRPDDQFFISSEFTNQIWEYLNEIMDTEMSVNESENIFGISPNPASDYIIISLSNKGLKPFVVDDSPSTKELQLFAAEDKVQIFDVLGIEVISEIIHPMTSSHQMNVESLPQGVYFIKIGNYTEKFVVVR